MTENAPEQIQHTAGEPASQRLVTPDAMRPRILFQPAVPSWDPAAGTILKPTVHLAEGRNMHTLHRDGVGSVDISG